MVIAVTEQDLVELDNADDSKDKKATKALLATELEIDQPRF